MKILRSLHYLRKLSSISSKRKLKIICNNYQNNIINAGSLTPFNVKFASILSETLITTGTASSLSSSLLPSSSSSLSTTDIQPQNNHKNEKNFVRNLSLEYIWTKLNTFYRMNGYIANEQLQPLIDFIEKSNSGKFDESNILTNDNAKFLNQEQELFLLEVVGCEMPSLSCEERINNFQLIWKYLEKCSSTNKLSPEHYHVMLDIFRRNRLPLTDYRSLLLDYEKVGGNIKSEIIYRKLLEVAGGCGDVSLGTNLLAEMRELQLPLNEHAFNSLLKANGRLKNKNGVKAIYDSMLATGVSIGMETQTTLALLAIENDERESFNSILLQFQGNFRINDILEMLESISNIKDLNWCEKVVEKLIKELPKDYVQQTDIPFELKRICMDMLYNDQWNALIRLVDSLPPPVFQDNQDVDTYGVFLLHALFRKNCTIDMILSFAMQLLESRKNSRALHIMAEIALRRNPPMSLNAFEALNAHGEKLKTHFFWPLFMYNFRRHNEYGILKTLKIMKDYGVECDTMTLNEYVLGKLPIILSNPKMALKQLNDVGLKTTNILLPIILHLFKQNKWLDVLNLLKSRQKAMATTLSAHQDHISLSMEELYIPLCNLAVHVKATKRYHQFAELISLFIQYQNDKTEDCLGQFLIELINRQGKRFGTEANDDLYNFQQLLLEFRKYPDLRISRKTFSILIDLLKLNEMVKKVEDEHSHYIKKKKDKKIEENDYHFIVYQKLKEIVKNTLQLKSRPSSMDSNADFQELESDQGKINQTSTSTYIKHPRDMSLNELEYHLVELESKNMNTRGVLRRLLQLYVRDDTKLDNAMEIKNKCDKMNIYQSPGMLASIVELYVKHKDLSNAEKYLEKLQKSFPGFLIDEHKFVDYASLLVENDQLEKAQNILKQRSELLNKKIIGGDYLLKNIWNLLTNVAQLSSSKNDLLKERNLTHEVFEFLKQYRYCKVQNLLLGPIIRERLLRNDLPAAIEDFQNLAKQYKHTPLQYELLTLLVRLSNKIDKVEGDPTGDKPQKYNLKDSEHAQDLLKVVTETIRKIHGSDNMNSGLLIAFAEAGTDNQLRRLILNPEFRLNEELLLRNCEHLSESGASQILLRLARGMRGTKRGFIDEQKIYKIILNNLVKENNYENALKLYQHITMDEELILEQDFLKILVDLLRANNLEIPSELALKARVYNVEKTENIIK